MSSTVRPEHVRLAFGHGRRVVVYSPVIKQREHRVLIADTSYSLRQLTEEKKNQENPVRVRLFETIKKLVEVEHARTGLPVAIIGRSTLVNLWNHFMLGKEVEPLKMTWNTADRQEKFEALRALNLGSTPVALALPVRSLETAVDHPDLLTIDLATRHRHQTPPLRPTPGRAGFSKACQACER